jgi:hypothetical protein
MATLRVVRLGAVLLLVLGAVVLAPHPVRAASAPASQDIMHEVLPGDCLHLIAGYYYGDTRLWERIWNANRPLLRNPHILVLGTYLLVPDAGDPPEPYPDFTARAIGCGPGRIPSTSAERAEGQAKAAAATQASPSKAR